MARATRTSTADARERVVTSDAEPVQGTDADGVELADASDADATAAEPNSADSNGAHSTEPADDELELPPTESAELAPVADDADAQPGQGDLLSDDELVQGVSALIFASPEPLAARRLAALLDGPRLARVTAALDALGERLRASGLPFELRNLAGGWQILTTPALAPLVQRLFKARKAERVSAAALETLAVVAYRQPVTKAEIEAIRGVQAGPILRTLIDRGLVRVTGRSDQPGHALQYGTTRSFLERFGLGGLEDLPRDIELARD